MATLRGRLDVTSRAPEEFIPREEWERLAEQARGMPVTLNWDPARIVGRVVGAEADGVGVYVEVEPPDDYARSFSSPPVRLGPGGVWRADGSFDLREVSLGGLGATPIENRRPGLEPDPKPEPPMRAALDGLLGMIERVRTQDWGGASDDWARIRERAAAIRRLLFGAEDG